MKKATIVGRFFIRSFLTAMTHWSFFSVILRLKRYFHSDIMLSSLAFLCRYAGWSSCRE